MKTHESRPIGTIPFFEVNVVKLYYCNQDCEVVVKEEISIIFMIIIEISKEPHKMMIKSFTC